MFLKKLFCIFLNKRNFFYKFIFGILIKFIKYFSLNTDELLSLKFKNIDVLKKNKDTKFILNTTDDFLANKIHKNLFGEYKVKGQFLLRITNCYLLTQWSIPITEDGYVLVEPSGKVGMLVHNILRSKNTFFFPELKFITFAIIIRFSYLFKLNFFKNISSYISIFHMVPRHGFKPLEPVISHWVFENLPQLKMFFEAILIDENCKLFIGEKLYDWQKLTLNLMGISDKQIFKIKKDYLIKAKNLYLSRLPYINSNDFIFQPKDRSWVCKTVRNSLKKKYNLDNDINKRSQYQKILCKKEIIK